MSSSSSSSSSSATGLPPTPTSASGSSNFYFLAKNGSFHKNSSNKLNDLGEDAGKFSRPNRTLSSSDPSSSSNIARRNSLRNAATTGLSSTTIIHPAPPIRSWWGSVVEAVIGKPILRSDSKVEPKIFLSNERTFLAWLDMAVTLAAISVAVLSMSEKKEQSLVYGLILLPISIGFCVYALRLYMQRNNRLRRKLGGPYNNDFGPITITVILAVALLSYFALSLYDLFESPNDPFSS